LEGCGRNSDAELGRFLRIALGSAAELECLIWLALDAGYVAEAQAARLSEETAGTRKMLAVLIRRLKPRC